MAGVATEQNHVKYGEILSARAATCLQDMKLNKMMTSLDLTTSDTGSSKKLPASVKMFDATKSINMFPAFKCRRERTLHDFASAKSNPERESLSKTLESAKAEQRKKTKSVFSVSGSRIRKRRNEFQYRPPKVWSLNLSRTLPNIDQCFTPVPPKTPNKNLSIQRDLQERKVTLAESSYALNLPYMGPMKRMLPKTPPNTNRLLARRTGGERGGDTLSEIYSKQAAKAKTQQIEMSSAMIIPVSGRKDKHDTSEGAKTGRTDDSAKSSDAADWVTIDPTKSEPSTGRIDKATMMNDEGDRTLTPSDVRRASMQDNPTAPIIKSSRSEREGNLQSRGGIRPTRILPDMPKLRYTNKKRDDLGSTSDGSLVTSSLPALPSKSRDSHSRPNASSSGRRSGPGFPKRPAPTPFKVAHTAFIGEVNLSDRDTP